MNLAENSAGGGVDGEELVGAGGGGNEGLVVATEFDGEGGGKGVPGLGMNRRERFELDEARFFSSVFWNSTRVIWFRKARFSSSARPCFLVPERPLASLRASV